jgi:hypothetical protein
MSTYTIKTSREQTRRNMATVQQGLADGHTVIIGHHYQLIAFCTDKEAIEK